jgi:multidrug efflux pump subunit AcrA (membrane-fusion protein)
MSSYQYTVLEKVSLHRFVEKFWHITFVIFLVILAFLFLPWQQTVKGTGIISAYDPTQRPYAVSATINGFIDEFHVEENQFVKKGDLLFTMVDLDRKYSAKLKNIEVKSQEQLQNTQKQILLSEEKKENLKEYLEIGLKVYAQKFAQTEDKIRSLRLKKVSLEKNHEIEKLNFERIALLYKDGIESKRKYDSMENIYIKAKADIDIQVEQKNIDIIGKEKEKFLKDTQNKIKSLDASILSSHNRATSIDQDLQRQSMTISRYETAEVYAQKDGYIVRLYESDRNKLLKEGEHVIYFAPVVSEKTLLLKVSDFNMPLIKEGLPVRLMFYGWPAMQISGWPAIKFGTFGGKIKKIDSVSYDKGFFYAYVVEDPNEPWPKGDVLKVGTQTTAWVRLETVPIWYQIWRTINGLPPRMLTPNTGEK